MSYNWCVKCGEDSGCSIVIEGGESFPFCKLCMKQLDELDHTGNIIHDFIGQDKKESQIAKNMREARERRAKGVLLW